MKLTPAQAAALKRLQKYRLAAPALGERLRLAAGFMMVLLLPVLLLGYLTVRLHFLGGLLLLAGLYVGAVAREIGQQRRFVHYWSLSREITDWDKVEQLLSGAKELPPVANPSPLGLRSLFRRFLLFGDLLLRFAPHLDERIDKIIDRLMPFRLASHPDQGVQKLIDRFAFLCHAAC
jgi:hypothetical protein